ncbi:MAG: toprim domain-containing protein [Nitrospina sp.]|nr:toprim domain-containing protein [Nitrospina sp.]
MKDNTYKKPNYELPQELPEEAYTYLVDERAIPEHILQRNKVGFVDGVFKFPFIKNGEIVNIKSRTLGKKFWQEEGAEKTFYGYDDIDNKLTIIVEGEFDKLAMEAAGFLNSVSVPDGAPSVGTKNYSSKFDFLDTCEGRLNEVSQFILAVDNDAPGKLLEEELARRLGWGRCSRVIWPEGCKDANETLIKHGPEAIKKIIDEAIPFPVEGVYWVNDLDIETLYERGLQPGLDTGWPSLDRHYSISQESGELHIVTGIPGHGKSEFLDALMVNLSKDEGWNIGLFSPENFPLEYHASKLIEKYIGKPFSDDFKTRMTQEELQTARQWLNEHFSFVMPDENNLTVTAILELAKILVYRRGMKALVIDPWNEVDHSRPNGMTETEYISHSLTKIRRFSRINNCHVFLVAHPFKMTKVEGKTYPVPTPYDISGSAHWRNKADNCLSVWRDVSPENQTFEVQIHIQKIRKKHIGRLGMVKLKYEYSTGRYFETS